jgi:hypothetical protein
MKRMPIAPRTGYSTSMLSAFRKLTEREAVPGANLDEFTRAINRFLETLVRRQENKRPEGFVETEVAKRILLVCEKAIEYASMALIVGDAGRGVRGAAGRSAWRPPSRFTPVRCCFAGYGARAGRGVSPASSAKR